MGAGDESGMVFMYFTGVKKGVKKVWSCKKEKYLEFQNGEVSGQHLLLVL